MSKIITKLPEEFDPVRLIKDKFLTCPLCGKRWSCSPLYDISRKYTERRDINGKKHFFRESLNRYKWDRRVDIKCECGCVWDTGWYPADYEMFKINVNKDDISESLNNMMKRFGLNSHLRILSDENLQELEDRYGDEVREFVEDILNRQGDNDGIT